VYKKDENQKRQISTASIFDDHLQKIRCRKNYALEMEKNLNKITR